jgi:hypothetical protein
LLISFPSTPNTAAGNCSVRLIRGSAEQATKLGISSTSDRTGNVPHYKRADHEAQRALSKSA